MATTTITYSKASAGSSPTQVGPRLRRIALDLAIAATEVGDAGLTGADVTLVTDDVAKTLTISGGGFAASRVIQLG